MWGAVSQRYWYWLCSRSRDARRRVKPSADRQEQKGTSSKHARKQASPSTAPTSESGRVDGAGGCRRQDSLDGCRNSSGGVLGKMISPQNLAVGTSATGLQGKEGDLLRLVLKWSLGLTLVMAVWVTLQAYVLKFLIP